MRLARLTFLLLLAAVLVTAAGGCRGTPKPWREDRDIGPNFRAEEWMIGTLERAVPIEDSFRQELAAVLTVGTDAKAVDVELSDGEPHGFGLRISKASAQTRKGGSWKTAREYEGDWRFWLAPDQRRLLAQTAWRDSKIEIIHADGQVKGVAEAALKDLDPTYAEFPFGFVRWLKDSKRIVVLSIHTPKARGYPFVARWVLDVETGERALVDENLLILSTGIANWRLVPIPTRPKLHEVAALLDKMAQDQRMEPWLREALKRTQAEIKKRMTEQP